MHHNAYPRPGQAAPEASLVFALEATEPKVTNGWRARLQGSPREGPESAPKPSFHCERETGFTEAEDPAAHRGRLCPNSDRSFLRHPCFAQAVVRPLVRLDAGWIAALCGVIRLPCRDRPERPGGGQREVALERLARFRIMIGQGERRHKFRMHKPDVVRIDRDRLARQFNHLVIALQPEIGRRL